MLKSKSLRNPREKKGKTLQEFHLFPKLSLELRCMIWNSARPGPQVVKCGRNPYKETREEKSLAAYDPWFTALYPMRLSAKIPATLHVNRESRLETQRWYTKCFETQLDCYVYMDLSQDILLFEEFHAMEMFFGIHFGWDFVSQMKTVKLTEQDMGIAGQKLRHLAFRELNVLTPFTQDYPESNDEKTAIIEQISKFLNLEKITILMPTYRREISAPREAMITRDLIGGLEDKAAAASTTAITKVPELTFSKESYLNEELSNSSENWRRFSWRLQRAKSTHPLPRVNKYLY